MFNGKDFTIIITMVAEKLFYISPVFFLIMAHSALIHVASSLALVLDKSFSSVLVLSDESKTFDLVNHA